MMAVLTELGADAAAVDGLKTLHVARRSISGTTRRTLLLAPIFGICLGARAANSLSPRTFPWAVDRQAHLAQRQTVSHDAEPTGYPGELLHRLHLALEGYWRAPDSQIALIHVRQRLLAVKLATQAPGKPPNWREVHDFAAILLNAAEWRRCI